MAAATARLCLARALPRAAAAGPARSQGQARAFLPAAAHARPGRRARALASAAGGGAGQPGSYLILEYDYVHHDAELLAKRAPYLEGHLKMCQDKADEGKLLLWGAVGTPVTHGMLIWRNADEGEVAAFVKRDPFWVNGLVRHWTIKPFHVEVEKRGSRSGL